MLARLVSTSTSLNGCNKPGEMAINLTPIGGARAGRAESVT
jgi:hypothetical protein